MTEKRTQKSVFSRLQAGMREALATRIALEFFPLDKSAPTPTFVREVLEETGQANKLTEQEIYSAWYFQKICNTRAYRLVRVVHRDCPVGAMPTQNHLLYAMEVLHVDDQMQLQDDLAMDTNQQERDMTMEAFERRNTGLKEVTLPALQFTWKVCQDYGFHPFRED